MCAEKKKILILSHFTDGGENTNDRFQYLADRLSEKYKVELVTSSFFHTAKRQHKQEQPAKCNYKIKYIYERGYKKNVCLSRFFSHIFFGRRVKKYLKNIPKTDKPKLIYCSVPSLSIARAAMKYAKSNNIPLAIDIQDLWPEAFKMIFNPFLLGSMLYSPLDKIANKIYESADLVVAVSETYIQRAKTVNKKAKDYAAIYLGTPFSRFDKCKKNPFINKSSDEYWLIYVGTLGHSYDLKFAMDAISILNKKHKLQKKVKFLVLGDGPLIYRFMDYAKTTKIDVEFKGRLPYEEMVRYLSISDLALNPISSGAAQSIINKHADYAAAALPVISTQDCGEYINLINRYEAGYNCIDGNAENMADVMFRILEDKQLRDSKSRNSRRLGEDLFDRDKTYVQIYECIDRLIDNIDYREGQVE